MIRIEITPTDVVFWGSGRPFNVGANAKSIFPPPHTVASAFYAMLLNNFKKPLGTNEKPSLFKQLIGPFLKKDCTFYLAIPHDIYVTSLKKTKSEDKKFYLARPVEVEEINGKKVVPWLDCDEIVEPVDGFISFTGFEKYLDGEILPNEIVEQRNIHEFFALEKRTSIRLDRQQGTVKEQDGLYSVEFYRLNHDVSLVWWMELNDEFLSFHLGIESEDDFLEIFKRGQFPSYLFMGGESKVVTYKLEKDKFPLPLKKISNQERNDDKSWNKFIFITPLVLTQNSYESCFHLVSRKRMKIPFYKNHYMQKSLLTIDAFAAGSLVYVKHDDFEKSGFNSFSFFDKNFLGYNVAVVI